MRYKRMGNNRDYRLQIPTLSGGVNAAAEASLIADNELADVCNLRRHEGMLKTRRAITATGELLGGFDAAKATRRKMVQLCQRPFEAYGELCTVVMLACDSNGSEYEREIALVNMDGAIKRRYRLNIKGASDRSALPMVAVPCDAAQYGSAFLLFRGGAVYREGNAASTSMYYLEVVDQSEMYAPLVMINGTSTLNPLKNPNGVMYEGYNLLTAYYRAQFTSSMTTADGADTYTLPAPILAGSTVTMEIVTEKGVSTVSFPSSADPQDFKSITINGDDYNVRAMSNTIVFRDPVLPKSTVSGNVTFTVQRDASNTTLLSGYPTLGAWFGGTNDRLGGTRLFLGGFGDATLRWSDVGNPLYFPENNFMVVGDPSQAITAFDKQEDMLVIFKARELFATTYVQGEIDAESVAAGTNVDVTTKAAYFPLTQLSPYIGCDCPQTVAMCRNRLVWMNSDARVFTLVAAGMYNERNVREIGQKIRPRLQRDHDIAARQTATAADIDGCYALMIDRTLYTFDYDASGFASLTSYTSEDKAAKTLSWFIHRFEALPDKAVCRLVSDGGEKAVLFVTEDTDAKVLVTALYTFTDDTADTVWHHTDADSTRQTHPIASYLVTKTFDGGDAAAFKRLKAAFLTLCGNVRVYTMRDGATDRTACRTVGSRALQTHMFLPSIARCRNFALRIEADTPLQLSALRVHYTPFGIVR